MRASFHALFALVIWESHGTSFEFSICEIKGFWISSFLGTCAYHIIDIQLWMGFWWNFLTAINGSHEATVWALTNLMGSCSWLQWMRTINCQFMMSCLTGNTLPTLPGFVLASGNWPSGPRGLVIGFNVMSGGWDCGQTSMGKCLWSPSGVEAQQAQQYHLCEV